MKTKIVRILIVSQLLLATVNPLTAVAASYLPTLFYHQNDIAETVMKAGQIAYLFHSGTEDVKRTIHVNDILIVYRISPLCEVKTVGKIKVISNIGDTYFKSEVVEGEIRPNDIAKKGNASCLVISVGLCSP
jgi:5,10-methylene-tetrahydrofolate dehydrogenase/methenyl tetrahydrofolate cyclohydrolase